MATQTTSFTYTISDGLATSTATVNVTIEDVSPAALAQDDGPVNVTAGNILFFDVLANDSPAGMILEALVAPNPTKGTAIIEGNWIKYTPNANQTGPDSVGYRARNTTNNTTDVGVLNIQINASAPAGVFTWGYPFPNAAAVDPARVRIMTMAQLAGPRPSGYAVGDIIVVSGPNGPWTGTQNDPGFDLLGPLVICGFDFRPSPHRYGCSNTANPYTGTNRVIMEFIFANNARSHASWEHEPGRSINWPFLFLCNSTVNYQTNRCQFGDTIRGGLRDAKPTDANKNSVGPQAGMFWNKIFYQRGPHYADDEFNANGTPTGRTNIFHSDGWQPSGEANPPIGNVVILRFANVHWDWIMGQAIFCGSQPQKLGFPRDYRMKFKNCSWEHTDPWEEHPCMPKPGADPNKPGNLFTSPRLIMNYEGGFGSPPFFEVSNYAAGNYWPTLLEGQNYVKKSAKVANPELANFGRPARTELHRYLDPTGANGGQGIASGIWDANGNWKFTTTVGPTHEWPAWQGNIRLLERTQTLPQVVDPAHCGAAHRLTSVAQFMTAIGR